MGNQLDLSLLDDPSAFLSEIAGEEEEEKEEQQQKTVGHHFQAAAGKGMAPLAGLFQQKVSQQEAPSLRGRITKMKTTKKIPKEYFWTPSVRKKAQRKLKNSIFKVSDNPKEIAKIREAAEKAVEKTRKKISQVDGEKGALQQLAMCMLRQAQAIEEVNEAYYAAYEDEIPFHEKVEAVQEVIEEALMNGETTIGHNYSTGDAIKSLQDLRMASGGEYTHLQTQRYKAIWRMSEIARVLGLRPHLLSRVSLSEHSVELFALLARQAERMLSKGKLVVRPEDHKSRKVSIKYLIQVLHDYTHTIPEGAEHLDPAIMRKIDRRNATLKGCIQFIPPLMGPKEKKSLLRGGLLRRIAQEGTAAGALHTLVRAAKRQETEGKPILRSKNIEQLIKDLRTMADEDGEVKNLLMDLAILQCHLLLGALKEGGEGAYDPESTLWEERFCHPDFLEAVHILSAPTPVQQEILSVRLGTFPTSWFEAAQLATIARFHAKCRSINRSKEEEKKSIQVSLDRDPLIKNFRFSPIQ